MHRLKKSDVHLERKQVFFCCFDVIRCAPSINRYAPEHQSTVNHGLSALPFAIFLLGGQMSSVLSNAEI